ncbi:MAG TPA: adenylate/guanylate cyclase domain-containing protein [Ramlibacter sp.]|jgi:TolB-like protein|nr:adenylate/guanylate cyclase domain-containing protein [Ramlibacter sp.]
MHDHRLLAVMVADAVGYSRLMAQDDRRTLADLDAARAIFSRLADEHGGRIVDTAGDSVLATFDTASGAVQAARAIQAALAEAAAGGDPTTRLLFRIGVHLGDVLVKADGSVYGDGVNVAARLQALAEAGSVWVSEAVRSAVRADVVAALEDAGEHQVKNIARAIRAFRLVPADTPVTQRPAEPGARRDALPRIAVLPFRDLSPDAAFRYFAEGLTEEIITALGRFKLIHVLTGTSSAAAARANADPIAAARGLGASYVLQGSVRRAGDQLRVLAQLAEVQEGSQLWTERFDGKVEESFAIEDEITRRVVNLVQPAIEEQEIRRARQLPPGNLAAYDLYLQAVPLIWSMQEPKNRRGLELLQRALEIDPRFVRALSLCAQGLELRLTRSWPAFSEDDARLAVRCAREAARANSDASATAMAGVALIHVARDFDVGLKLAQNALRANPGNGLVMQLAGFAHIAAGDLHEAVRLFRQSRDLSPHPRGAAAPLTGLGTAHFLLGDIDESLRCFTEVADSGLDYDATHVYWCCSAAEAGDIQLAHELRDRVIQAQPAASLRLARERLPFREPARLQRVIAALRKAGFEEG